MVSQLNIFDKSKNWASEVMLRSTITGKPHRTIIFLHAFQRVNVGWWRRRASSSSYQFGGGDYCFLMCIQAFSSGISEEMQFVCECLFKNSEVRSLSFESSNHFYALCFYSYKRVRKWNENRMKIG